eukprot:UN04292
MWGISSTTKWGINRMAKGIKNRHLYQNLFTKMSYQASTIYDPANNIGDTMDDIPNFLSQPQQIINGVIIENDSSRASMQSLETWELQQEEQFLQEQAQNKLNAFRGAGGAPVPSHSTSGGFQTFTPNPLSPRIANNASGGGNTNQSTSSGGYNNLASPPPLPRRAKPSFAQWEQAFHQHMNVSGAPASILATMLQPVSIVAPLNVTPLSLLAPQASSNNATGQAPPPIPPVPAGMTPQAASQNMPSAHLFSPQGNIPSPAIPPQPVQTQMSQNPIYNPMNQQYAYQTNPTYDPTAQQSPSQPQQQQQQQQPVISYDIPTSTPTGGALPPPPQPPANSYTSFYGGASTGYGNQYHQAAGLGYRRPPMQPPQPAAAAANANTNMYGGANGTYGNQ